MTEPACGHLDAAVPGSGVAARLNLSFPQAHRDGAGMARLALGIKTDKAAALFSLPFCCTIEAEALGASVTLGDADNGPRAKEFVCSSLRDVLRLKEMDFAAGRIAQVLEACRLLVAGGERVALEISGPMTILNWLMDLRVVFREWRKDGELMRETVSRLRGELLRYALEAGRKGVNVLCHADPAGTLAILGPERFSFMADAFLLPFLRGLEAEDSFKAAVQVCPKTSHALVRCGRAVWRDLPLKHPMRYDEGCLAAAGGTPFLGEACMRDAKHYLRDGIIKGLVLSG